jgi:hypothetical protein
MDLLKVATGIDTVPLNQLDLSNHILSDPFLPVEHKEIKPQYWMPIPKLPGEEEVEKLEALHTRRDP